MKLTIVTGLCGSGKTTFCKDKTCIPYDSVYDYKLLTLNYEKIDNYLLEYKDTTNIYLDAYDNNLLEYLRSKVTDIEGILLYMDIDDYYNIIAIKEPRNFCQNPTYTNYVTNMINTIEAIQQNLITHTNNITYKYRKDNMYTDYKNEEHLFSILRESHVSRLLGFIDRTSGAKDYQSIMLHGEYIRRGTERDWLTFDNILKCTSLKNKVVCDTGCFNGYFSFRCLDQGARQVIGIDHNKAALNICNKLAIYNNMHQWANGNKKDTSCDFGINFYEYKIGRDPIFGVNNMYMHVDIIFALNYLHHLKIELGEQAFLDTIDSFFKNASEVIFEVNECEEGDIARLATKNNFSLQKKLESHRRTSFGNRQVLYYKKFE